MPVKNMDGVALYNEKQNEIVRQCLRDALVILMKQKKYDTISISELCRKAGVSRSGFYNNFSALADVFKEIARTFIQEITEKNAPFQNHNSLKWYERFFELVELHANDYRVIVSSAGLREKYLDVSNEIMLDHDWIDEKEACRRLAFNGAIQNVAFQWIKDDMKLSRKKMATWCYHFLERNGTQMKKTKFFSSKILF